MGRTLPSTTQVFQQIEASLSRYRRALRREDQLVLDELLDSAQKHMAEAGYAANMMPFETHLLSMLLEEHKEVVRLREIVTRLEQMHQ